nr:MAG TPA: hypothetical protein [Caudoviricetes sp.]
MYGFASKVYYLPLSKALALFTKKLYNIVATLSRCSLVIPPKEFMHLLDRI